MTSSRFPTMQFTSEQFVESAGAVLFRISTREICLLYLIERGEYILAKGRRNCGETAQNTAIREVEEETGYPCYLLPVKISTRAPPKTETKQLKDIPRTFRDITEPFTLQVRQLGEFDIKIIWWYIAAINEDASPSLEGGEQRYRVEFFDYEEAIEKLTYQHDREMVKNAVDIVQATYN